MGLRLVKRGKIREEYETKEVLRKRLVVESDLIEKRTVNVTNPERRGQIQ